MVRIVEREQEQPDEGEEPSALPEPGGFRGGQVEVTEERPDIKRVVHPARHMFGDLRQLEGTIAAAGVLEVDDPNS
jgi:hypothetical protein